MAESLYWIGRYVERAEQTARITDVTFSHTLAMGSTPEAEARRQRHWAALLDIVGERAAFPPEGPEGDEETVPAHLIFSSENPNSIVECIARARENARTMRHQLATEMWEALNRFHLDVQRPGRRRRRRPAPRAPRASAARSSSSASSCRASPTRRCRARRAGTSCRQASSSSGRSGRRARSTSTTGCSSARTPSAAIAMPSPRRRTTCSRGERSCARSRRTSRTTASRAGASSRAR